MCRYAPRRRGPLRRPQPGRVEPVPSPGAFLPGPRRGHSGWSKSFGGPLVSPRAAVSVLPTARRGRKRGDSPVKRATPRLGGDPGTTQLGGQKVGRVVLSLHAPWGGLRPVKKRGLASKSGRRCWRRGASGPWSVERSQGFPPWTTTRALRPEQEFWWPTCPAVLEECEGDAKRARGDALRRRATLHRAGRTARSHRASSSRPDA